MGFWGTLFSSKADQPPSAGHSTELRVINQADHDPPILVDPQRITHAFIALTLRDTKHADAASNYFSTLGKACQPRIWATEFKTKFVTFAVNPMPDVGDPNAMLIVQALESQGLRQPSAVIINYLTVSFDGSKTQSNIGTGFAFPDSLARVVLARIDGCAPVAL